MNHLEEREVMKFVLNGRSFDTATAATVAIYRGAFTPEQFDPHFGAEQVRFEWVLYRTQKGAFFIHDHESVKYPKGKPVISDEAKEATAEEAVKWISEHGAAVLDGTGLQLPDEA